MKRFAGLQVLPLLWCLRLGGWGGRRVRYLITTLAHTHIHSLYSLRSQNSAIASFLQLDYRSSTKKHFELKEANIN